MLVIHAAWDAGRLVLWAEDAAGAAPSATRAKVRPHPFAAPADALAAALPGWGDTAAEAAGKAVSGEVVLLLPGSASGPLPSPETGLRVVARRAGIRPWRVFALLLDAGAALRLLTTLDEAGHPSAQSPEPEDHLADIVAGPSLRFLSVVAAHVRDLVRRGRVLPQFVSEADGYAARWRPVLTGPDAARFRELAAAMPPVCRAVTEERPSAHVLIEAIAALTDAAVRQALPERLLGGHRPGRRSPLADRWTVALTGDAAALPGVRHEEAEALARPLRDWFRAAHQLDGPVKVSFRLVEPRQVEPSDPGTGASPDIAGEYAAAQADGGAWRLEFALQSAEDPSLYLPAPLLWAGETMPGLPGRPDEVLLTGLGRAARLYPKINDALRQARPAHVDLDVENAFHFLRHAAPLLQSAGFGVRLPAWAGRTRLGLKLTARSRSGPGAAADQGFGLEQLVDFRAELALGEEAISEEELAELARLKVPLIRLRGQWVELDARQLDAALKAVERSGRMTVGEVIQEVVHGGDDDLPLVAVDADGLLGDLLSGEADRRLEPVATPAAFHGTLRPYQERGLAWLDFMSQVGLGAILADDMGLGKTLQTLSLLLREREQEEQVGATLLVCPMSLLSNWQKEAARFAPSLDVYLHHGTGRLRDEELAERVGVADLVLTTYGTALRDRDALTRFGWARIVCDEAQAIKNAAARQAQAVRSLPARTRLALTGTPVENHLAELWSIMEFCNPGLLGSAKVFRGRYQEPIERRGDETATTALKRATGPFVLRRLKTDKTIISDLPDKMEMKVWCTLTPEQASLYQAVVEDMMDRIAGSEGIERRGNVLAAMTRLKQVCNHPAHLLKDGSRLAGRSGKLARLEELAEEILSEGDKALVFTQYAEFGSMLQPYLAARLDRPVLWLHGGLPKKTRDALVERFQAEDEPMIFLLSLKAAGTGLNLTAACHVVHVDRWWNPAVENQATDRAFRIGQTRNVQVRKFICAGTLEERIDEMIERKKALAESVVGTGEDWIAGLSTAELRELFRLSPEAVS
ncbi:DEAD/DEAH box helicase [Microbispora bryophytorum]|uniref:Helicase HelZ n=1 Tax=Microbispora bryophytorum TaxID=1460882 RepID=A0A8H9LE15_9ACTN|nr:DEAD/DEAH box helicase [Microbispora bryophytorum]MBD3136957.1 DEAD/DEAH box helicase [Microbispora bryophytorum]TQS07223.1 DEAD/DEAH box helicase [Microbispora bryophytorum]GGO13776.1 helicase HelZ [Microbispora bryophytorum]